MTHFSTFLPAVRNFIQGIKYTRERKKNSRGEKKEAKKIRKANDAKQILEIGAASKFRYTKELALYSVGSRQAIDWLIEQGLDKNHEFQLMAITGLDEDLDREVLMLLSKNGHYKDVRDKACAAMGHSWRFSDGVCEICNQKLKPGHLSR